MTPYIDFRAVAQQLLADQLSSNLYFLLDGGGLPGLHRQLRKSSVEWSSLFDDTREANALQVAPFLVLVGNSGQLRMCRSLLDWIGTHGTYSSSVVMLSTPLDMASLRNRLAARLKVKLSENMEAMLRFFDPRILESLITVLPAEQAKMFFSPAEVWRYVDRAGKLVSRVTVFDINETFNAPLLLGEGEEFALIEACEIDQVLGSLRENLPKLLATLSLPDQAAFVSRTIGIARQQGVSSIYKLSLCAAVLLSKGQTFVDGPHWAQIVEALKREDFAPDQLDMLDPDDERRYS